MSHVETAVILLRLDARRGEVVSVADLADHTGLAPDLIAKRIQELWEIHWVLPEVEWTNGVQTIVGAMALQRMPACA